MPNDPLQSRRMMVSAAKRLLVTRHDEARRDLTPDADFPRLTLSALEKISMSRSRERILNNLDDMYREAFDRAKTADDSTQMTTLDFAYRREQLYLEILLDIRDAMERR
ncbi:MAG TPA: hypothetical protein VFK16_08840 [Gemmatimonadaceae bacterium]|jgi:hypothetical protein|nr:hypothetical protein [Gemmatimonadaceae bacterium]